VRKSSFKRVATGARTVLLCGAVVLILAGTAGVALAGGGFDVPELSPGAIGGAMTLLGGGLLLIRERLRSQ
jgi:hypothetical protein